MSKTVYDLPLIYEIMERDEAKIVIPDKVANRDQRLDFCCACGNTGNKDFRSLYRNGAFCRPCSIAKSTERKKQTNLKTFGVEFPAQSQEIKDKIRATNLKNFDTNTALRINTVKQYNMATLHAILDRHNACLAKPISTPNRETRVQFFCSCGKVSEKTFRMLDRTGAFCATCTTLEKTKKTKQTCMQKYGVENLAQADIIKDKIRNTNIAKYGSSCSLHNDTIKSKVVATCIQRFGVCNPFSAPEVKTKIVETNMQKFGVRYPMQSSIVKEKSKETCLTVYGCEYALQSDSVKQKTKTTLLSKYGVTNVSQCPDVQQQKISTNRLRFGCDHPSQNETFFRKIKQSAFSEKRFLFPCGTERSVQGYEPFALTMLIDLGYVASDIVTDCDEVPEIWYNKPGNQKASRYYCDIYIPKENRIIEVKSLWTFELDKAINLCKAAACIQMGYMFELWVFDSKGNCTVVDTTKI